MSNLSIPKRIAAITVILLVLLLPAYLAYNAQSEQDMAGSKNAVAAAPEGGGEGEGNGIDGSGEGEDGAGGGIADPDASAADGADNPSAVAPLGTPEPHNADVIDSIRTSPTPTPVPTPTPKWAPEYPATDGKVLISNLVEEDSVNVLILGIDRSAHLADTIGVVSISVEKKTVKLIMFPRDLFIGYSDDMMNNIKKIRHNNLPGEYKFNNTYNVAKNTEKYATYAYNDNRFENRGFDFFAQVVYEKFDIFIEDFVQINTYGFVKLVDTFGGVRINVPVNMRYHDPDQNLNINISKGSQVLNGTQAEGFVRFRQGYDSQGNLSIQVDRTENQITFLKAFYEQHAKISNISKIPDVISILRKNIIHSITMDDIFTKYVDLLTLVVNEKYSFETVQFDTKSVKKLDTVYINIKGLMPTPTPPPPKR